MEMNEESNFNDFFEGFDEGTDNQTGVENEQPADGVQTDDESVESKKDEKEETDLNGEEKPAEQESAEKTKDGEIFTLKVNKEERTYSREEVISLAQRGADYDRVKEQLATSRQTEESLRTKLAEQSEALGVLEEVAKASGVKVSELLDNLRIGMIQKTENVSADVARERLLRLKAENEAKTLKATAAEKEPTAKEKAEADVAAFRKEYPDVELTQELMDKLLPGVKQGKTMAESYREYEVQKMQAEIEELREQLAAEKQNKQNLAASPGSQKDSGGKRTKDDYDEFMKAFS